MGAVSREPRPTAHPLGPGLSGRVPALFLALPVHGSHLRWTSKKVTGQKENHSQDEVVVMMKMMVMGTASFKMIWTRQGSRNNDSLPNPTK